MSYTALYRKYRPATFDEVVGQEHITKTLRNQIISGRVGHAYLFNGGRGTGKTSSAKILARAINCLNPKDGNPCNECDICKAAINGSLTDIVEMDAASNNSVEDIRLIRDEVNFLPTVAKYRVYIIDEVHMLSISAFNALLKTLEEPPEHVKFILATTEPQKLPATILSRCQRFDFKKLSVNYIKQRLEYICKDDKIDIDPEAINTISILADGAMRDGISILERCLQEEAGKITNELVKNLVGLPKLEAINKIVNNILDYDAISAVDSVNEVLADGKDILNLNWEIIKYVKDILVYKTTQKADIYNKTELEQIKKLSDKATKERLMGVIFELSELSNRLSMTSQKTIMFQVAIMKLSSKEQYIASTNSSNEGLIKNEGKAPIDSANIDGGNVKQAIAGESSINISNGVDAGQNLNSSGSNVNFSEVDSRISNIENKLQRTVNAVQKLIQNPELINKNGKNVDNQPEKKTNSANRLHMSDQSINSIITTKTSNVSVPSWEKIVGQIKEEGKVTLYSNLANSNAFELNDMTVGIGFPDGLTPFVKTVVASSENISELTKLVSMEYGKPMQIRLIDNSNEKAQDDPIDSIMKSLDLPLNIIE